MMTPKKLWINSAILLLGNILIQNILHTKSQQTESAVIFTFVLDQISNIITICILGAGLGTLMAFIPYKQKKFKEKFETTLPLSISIILFLLVISFGYIVYLKKVKGSELKPLHSEIFMQLPKCI